MAGIVATTMSGGANKAVAGSLATFVGAEFIAPIVEWGVDIASAALPAPIPDTAQWGIQGLALLAFGFLVGYLFPANRTA